ncbi:MAG: hypothetical protein MI974_20290 [Chitinophagales bacterium]|nr:hypothetical protein [Chitinophagales bacterium]
MSEVTAYVELPGVFFEHLEDENIISHEDFISNRILNIKTHGSTILILEEEKKHKTRGEVKILTSTRVELKRYLKIINHILEKYSRKEMKIIEVEIDEKTNKSVKAHKSNRGSSETVYIR